MDSYINKIFLALEYDELTIVESKEYVESDGIEEYISGTISFAFQKIDYEPEFVSTTLADDSLWVFMRKYCQNLQLEDFSTDNFMIEKKKLEPTDEKKLLIKIEYTADYNV